MRCLSPQVINNQANAFGVGFFTVMYDQASFSGFEDVLFENNHNDLDFGLAGGSYIQGGPFAIQRSSFINNQARGAGGLLFGSGANGEMPNSTVYGNIANNTLGGGHSRAAVLSSPADHGVFTPTLASAVNFPGNDAANPAFAKALDQRRYWRDRSPDLGAYEWPPEVVFVNGFE